MSSQLQLKPIDRADWERTARQFDDYSYRQLWAYSVACAERHGATSEHMAARAGAKLLGLVEVRVKPVPVLGGGIAYVSGGPLVHRGPDQLAHLRAVLEAVSDEYVERRGLTLRVQPPLAACSTPHAFNALFSNEGFEPSTSRRPYRTVTLDLRRPLEDIRAGFKYSWRRHLNGAERNDLDVEFGTDPAMFETFCRIYDQFRDRKEFDTDLPADFYGDLQPVIDEPDRFLVGLAYANGKPVAGHVASCLGDACVYVLGATLEEALKLKASYLLHWKVIEHARQLGLATYDLGGIDPEENPGVTSFKTRMGGDDVTAPGPYEVAPCGVRATMVRAAESVYRSLVQKRPLPAAARLQADAGHPVN